MEYRGDNKALDIRALAFKLRKENPGITLDKVADRIMSMPAPRFYITFENARRFVSAMVRGTYVPHQNKYRELMYRDLYRKFIEMDAEEKSRKGVYHILHKILNSEAPSFYVSKDTIKGWISCSESRAIEKNNRWYL